LSIIGVATGKNSLGLLCMVSGLFLSWYVFVYQRAGKRRGSRIEFCLNAFALTLTVWLLIVANSATSLACFLVGAAVMILMGRPVVKRNIENITTFLFAAILVVVCSEWLFGITEGLLALLGRDPTLTDRTILWQDLVSMVNNPLIGTGYNGFWLGERMGKLWERWWWHPTQSHNGYLETYLELGLIGLICLVSLIVVSYKNVTKKLLYDFEVGRLEMTFFVVALLYNFTESAFKGLHLMWFVFLLTVVKVCGPKRTVKCEE
jgi:exopolysaccharide production protein ExoQ